MITEAILDVFLGVLDFVCGFIPFFDISIDTTSFDLFFDIIKSVAFFLPMGTVYTIFNIIIAIMTFRIVVSIIKTIWQLIPIL